MRVNGGLACQPLLSAPQSSTCGALSVTKGTTFSTQALIQSITGLASLFLNPLIASITDAKGRRPVLIFALLVNFVICVARAVRPTIGSVIVSWCKRLGTLRSPTSKTPNKNLWS